MKTATLLEKALDGAASKGAQTEIVHLYDLDFKGVSAASPARSGAGRATASAP